MKAVEHNAVSTSYEELSALAGRIAGSVQPVASTPSPRVLLALPLPPVKRVVGAKKGDDRGLSCGLRMGVETVPLYSLESAEELDRLAECSRSRLRHAHHG